MSDDLRAKMVHHLIGLGWQREDAEDTAEEAMSEFDIMEQAVEIRRLRAEIERLRALLLRWLEGGDPRLGEDSRDAIRARKP